jgi:signal transduction histidine kinase
MTNLQVLAAMDAGRAANRDAEDALRQQRRSALQVIRWAYTVAGAGYPFLLIPLWLKGDPALALTAEYVVVLGGAGVLWMLRRDDSHLGGGVVTISFGLICAFGFLEYGPTLGTGFMGFALVVAVILFHRRVWLAMMLLASGAAAVGVVHELPWFPGWAFEPTPWEWARMTTVVLVVTAGGGLVFHRMQEAIVIAWQREAAAQAERAEAERNLERAQRLEAIGQLAGGVAHDFNNILTAVIGFNGLAAGALEEGHPARRDIEDSTTAAKKAADLTRQLLAFGRRDEVTPCEADLNKLLANTDRFLRRVIGENVDLHYVPSASPLRCLVDPGKFEQVIVNLAVNARDAMPLGGTLRIEARPVALDRANADHGITPGEYALVEVTDNGSGIPADILEHIYEPFFTTKGLGKGTGLGLATCYGIVKQAGGHIAVDTDPDLGTTFKVYLPLASSTG